MRDVDDEHVDAGADQLGGALEVVAGGADRGANHQPALAVAGRERQLALPGDVARRDQTDQPPVRVHERQLLDLALDHHPRRFLVIERALVHDEAVRPASSGRATRAPARSTNRMSRWVSTPLQLAVGVEDDQRADA